MVKTKSAVYHLKQTRKYVCAGVFVCKTTITAIRSKDEMQYTLIVASAAGAVFIVIVIVLYYVLRHMLLSTIEISTLCIYFNTFLMVKSYRARLLTCLLLASIEQTIPCSLVVLCNKCVCIFQMNSNAHSLGCSC